MACEHLICIIICFILQKGGLFYKNREDFTWRVPDCEELVGVTHRRLWGWFYKVSFLKELGKQGLR